MEAVTATSIIIGIVLLSLFFSNKNTELIIWGGVLALTLVPINSNDQNIVLGVISISDAFNGITNEGVITIGALFVVAAGVKETGIMNLIFERAFYNIKSESAARLRIVGSTSIISAFFNNTPLVALMIPLVNELADKYRISVSRVLMPLSFAAILGGSCTLIGTNTNLIINSWLIENYDHVGFGIFEITPVMLPVALCAISFLIYFSPLLLPSRKPVLKNLENIHEHIVEMIVDKNSFIIGRTVTEAGLRGLKGLYLIEIVRRNQSLAAVSSNIKIEEQDRLYFVGTPEVASDLEAIHGLIRPEKNSFRLFETENRTFVEVVVKNSSPVIGSTIRDGQFRTLYSAAVIAVARNGRHVQGKIGDITLQEGDALLLETRKDFLSRMEKKEDFYIINQINKSNKVNYRRALLSFLIVLTMIVTAAWGLTTLFTASITAATAMVLSKCCSVSAARRSIEWNILLIIAGTLALGKAMETSDLAPIISTYLFSLLPHNNTIFLLTFFCLSSIISNLISSKAGALFVLPIAASTAQLLFIPLIPLVVMIMIGASMAVASPLAYPTNLMVYGPGGYFFSDYLRLGIPVTIISGIVGIILVQLMFLS